MSEGKLLTCPFCGTSLTNEKPSKLYVHEKTGCIMDLRGFTEDQLEAWNTRKPMERIVERLEEKKKDAYDRLWDGGSRSIGFGEAIEIVKEEGLK